MKNSSVDYRLSKFPGVQFPLQKDIALINQII